MPPRSRRPGPSSQTTAFGRTHPNLQRILLLSCEAGPFLMIATIATGAGIWKRPLWQRAMLWRAALWSFLSRWILVGCAVTWSWNEWGREDGGGEGGDEAMEERGGVGRERARRQVHERMEMDGRGPEEDSQRIERERGEEQGEVPVLIEDDGGN